MLQIQRMISKYNNSSRNGNSIKYIVLHYTANKGDTAYNNAVYFGGGDRQASAHYFVSDKQIYQVVEDDRAAWSVGNGGNGINNFNSINIEMCCFTDGQVSLLTEANTVDLVKYLIKKHNIKRENIKRHYDVTGKNCPNWTNQRWESFKGKLSEENKEESKLLNVLKKCVVKRGSTGTEVYILQGSLIKLGYDPKGLDGKCGPGCEAAIAQYQKDNSLVVDKSCGPATWTSILTK